MKHSTAIGHLVETGEVSSEQLRFRGTDIGWPVDELWVTGDLLGLAETVEAGSVVLVLDVPPDEAPWLAINPAGEWAGDHCGCASVPCCGATDPSVLAGVEPPEWPARPVLVVERHAG